MTGPFSGEYFVAKKGDEEAAKTEKKVEAKKEEVAEEAKKAVEEDALNANEGEAVAQKAEEEEEEDEGEDVAEMVSLFKFNFVNVTQTHYVAQGVFGENGAYQAVISASSAPSFSMTIYRLVDGKTAEYTTVLAKKYVPPKQPTFMQKYGMLFMMGAMMIMQMAKGPMGAANQAAAPAAGDAPAGDAPAAPAGAAAPAAAAAAAPSDS